jgi:hypothetical protein
MHLNDLFSFLSTAVLSRAKTNFSQKWSNSVRWRVLALCLSIGSFLITAYFGWASYRISGPVLFEEMREGNPNWPRKWPYPDEWLWRWNDQLDAEDPGPPGTLKMHGELPTMQMKLMG